MNKSICALVHRPGSTREAFQRYYEENHVPLAIGLFPFSAYVRNHLVDPGEFGWDTISEFWADDIARAAALMDGPVGDTMRADEARFMDQSRIAPGSADETILSQGARADAEGRRTALLVAADDAQGDVTSIARAWAASLAADRAGVSLDIVTAWQTPAFPAAAVIWLPGWDEPPAAPAGLSVRGLRARRIETPTSALLSQAGGGTACAN